MNWLRKWIMSAHRQPTRPRPWGSFRPTFEAMEDRIVLSGSPVIEPPSYQGTLIAQVRSAESTLSLNDQIVQFVRANLHRTVGNGSCAALVEAAFAAAGARTFKDPLGVIRTKQLKDVNKITGGTNTVLTFTDATFKINKQTVRIDGQWLVDRVDQTIVRMHKGNERRRIDLRTMKTGVIGVFTENYKWGNLVGQARPGDIKDVMKVIPGDVLQFRNVVFTKNNGQPGTYTFPHHSAIVTRVDAVKKEIEVYEQHVNGNSFVTSRVLNMGSLAKGKIWARRPVANQAPTPPAPTPVPPVTPSPPAPNPETVTHERLGYLWDVIALTRNALQAPWLSEMFGTDADDVTALANRPAAGASGELATAWILLLDARELIVTARQLFDEARHASAEVQGQLVAQGNASLAEARPLVDYALASWADMRNELFAGNA